MTDGRANRVCSYPVSTNIISGRSDNECSNAANDACDDAVNASGLAFRNYNIMVNTVGFGQVGYLDVGTMSTMASWGNGSYYFADLGQLENVYTQITQQVNSWIIEVNETRYNETIETRYNYTTETRYNYTIETRYNTTVETRNNYTIETRYNVTNVTMFNETNETRYRYENKTVYNQTQVNKTETIRVNIYTPQTTYDYLKLVLITEKGSYAINESLESLPAPTESKQIDINLDPSWGITSSDIIRIEIYAVVRTEEGEEILSPAPVAVWEPPSAYSLKSKR